MSKLPEEWRLEETGNITIVGAGTGFKIDFQGTTDKDIPFYKVSDMNLPGNAVFMNQANNYIDHEDMKILKAKTFPKHTLIFPKVGAALLTNKRRILTQDSCIDNNIMALIPIESKVDPIFLYSVYLHIDFNNLSNDGALPSLNGSQVKKIKIPLPPLEEQKKIAEILSTVDQKIAFVDNRIEETELLKKGLMHKLLTEGIGHTEFKDSEIGRIPVEWEVVKLIEICEINMGQSPKSETYNEENIGTPLIQGNADIKNRKTFPRIFTTKPTKICNIGDIIMTVRAPVGKVAISYHNACIGRGVCSISPNEDNNYIYYFLVGYEEKWDKLSQGSTFTAVNGNDIKNIKLPYPPLKEQKKIAEILSTTDEKLEILKSKKESFEELKKGLMQKLLTGEVRVKI